MAPVETKQRSTDKRGERGRGTVTRELDRLLDSAIVFWRGTSGYAYVHTVYTLAGCPPLPPAAVLLVNNQASDQREILDVIGVGNAAPTLNLAEVRRRGAQLGANEVHVHFVHRDDQARQTAVADLRTRHAGCAAVGSA